MKRVGGLLPLLLVAVGGGGSGGSGGGPSQPPRVKVQVLKGPQLVHQLIVVGGQGAIARCSAAGDRGGVSRVLLLNLPSPTACRGGRGGRGSRGSGGGGGGARAGRVPTPLLLLPLLIGLKVVETAARHAPTPSTQSSRG